VSRNQCGQAWALMVLTPIVPGREDALRAYLKRLGADGAPSPLERVPGTHFARWVVVDRFVTGRKQHSPDNLALQYLIFTSNLDGPVDTYLDGLCAGLGSSAEQIWGCCVGCPSPATGAALKAYLLHNQIEAGLFFSAYPKATVADVRRSLSVCGRMIDFAVAAQRMGPATLQEAFIKEFGR
jgi:hypothetical protein